MRFMILFSFPMYSAAATACEYSIREEEGKDKWNQTKELREEVMENRVAQI